MIKTLIINCDKFQISENEFSEYSNEYLDYVINKELKDNDIYQGQVINIQLIKEKYIVVFYTALVEVKPQPPAAQQFQIGDIAYILDQDKVPYESVVDKIQLIDDKFIYSCDTEFENSDIGDWVFKTEVERDLYLEALNRM